VRVLAGCSTNVNVRYMDDVPICWVISDDCRVRGENLRVGKVCTHVRVCGIFVEMLYLFMVNLLVYWRPK